MENALATRLAGLAQDQAQPTVCPVLEESTCSRMESASVTRIVINVLENLGRSVLVALTVLI